MSVIAPDCARAGEALLLSYGFTEAKTLSLRLAKVLENLKCQVSFMHTVILYNVYVHHKFGRTCTQK